MITLPARPESLTFAPQQSALIVVDMQECLRQSGRLSGSRRLRRLRHPAGYRQY